MPVLQHLGDGSVRAVSSRGQPGPWNKILLKKKSDRKKEEGSGREKVEKEPREILYK